MRYDLNIFFTMEALSSRLNKRISSDISHFHRFLEDNFAYKKFRNLDFNESKKIYQKILYRNSRYIANIKDYDTAIVRRHVQTGMVERFEIFDNIKLYQSSFIFINVEKILFCGGFVGRSCKKHTYTYDFVSQLQKAQNMKTRRWAHSLCKYNEHIYAISGMFCGLKSEKYNVLNEDWTSIADSPVEL